MKSFKKISLFLLVAVMVLSACLSTFFVNAQTANLYSGNNEFSDAFAGILTDNKLVLNFVKPSSVDDEIMWIAAEDFNNKNPDFFLNPEKFSDDLSTVELVMYHSQGQEVHLVDVVWNYDAEVLAGAKAVIENFPSDWATYISLELSDLELVNYWAYQKPGVNNGILANFSGEFKSVLGESNFYFEVQRYGGGNEPFYTTNGGTARLMHNGICYQYLGGINAKANHVIYVPESTADTKKALIDAAQKRIDDYIGKNVVKLSDSGETVSEFYNNEIANYDKLLETAQTELDNAKAILDAEMAKDESLRDSNVINQCNDIIFRCEWDISLIPDQKEAFIEYFEEDGLYSFLNNAAGEFILNAEVKKGETHKFVIIKDDTKLTVPSYKCTDLKTKVSVTTDSSEVPLDTNVKIDKLTQGEEHDKIYFVLGIEEGETFDIELYSQSTENYIKKLKNGKFKVKIPIPKDFENKTLVVYYVDAYGNKIAYKVTVDNGFAFFETNHFSIYTLAVESDVTPTTKNTGDINNDGTVGTTDLAILKKIIAGLETETPAADIDADVIIGTTDLALLKKYVAGLIS